MGFIQNKLLFSFFICEKTHIDNHILLLYGAGGYCNVQTIIVYSIIYKLVIILIRNKLLYILYLDHNIMCSLSFCTCIIIARLRCRWTVYNTMTMWHTYNCAVMVHIIQSVWNVDCSIIPLLF